MENKNTEILSSMYNSYGPMIGKICENTNNFMKENFLESSVQNHIVEEIKIPVPSVQFNPVPQVHQIQNLNSIPKIPFNQVSTQVSTQVPIQVSAQTPTQVPNPVSSQISLQVTKLKNQVANISNMETKQSSNLPELKSEVIEEQQEGGSIIDNSFLSRKIKIFG